MKNTSKMFPKGSPHEGEFAKDKTFTSGSPNGSNNSGDKSKNAQSKSHSKRILRKK